MSPFKDQDVRDYLNLQLSSYFAKPPLLKEEEKQDLEDLGMSAREYHQYKQDILKDLEKEKQKSNFREMKEMINSGIDPQTKVILT